jgi:hypothetical protein
MASRGCSISAFTNEQAWEVGLACGGKVQSMSRPCNEDAILERLLKDRAASRPLSCDGVAIRRAGAGVPREVFGD